MNTLTKQLRNLKLSRIAKTLEIRNKQAIKEKLSYIEFLELLIDREYRIYWASWHRQKSSWH